MHYTKNVSPSHQVVIVILEDEMSNKKYISRTGLKTILKCSKHKINSCLTNLSFWSLLIKLRHHFQLISVFNLLWDHCSLEMKQSLLPHKPLDRISITLVSFQSHTSLGAHVLPLSTGNREHQVNLSHLNVSCSWATYISVNADMLKCYSNSGDIEEVK